MKIADRINLIMEREGMKSSVFADSIGLHQSRLSHLLTGRNEPTLKVIMKIYEKYSYLNLEWLLYGKGKMTKEHTINSSSKQPYLFDLDSTILPKTEENSNLSEEKTSYSSKKTLDNPLVQNFKYIEKPSRKIVEIRIFFDDNTYEIFKSEDK